MNKSLGTVNAAVDEQIINEIAPEGSTIYKVNQEVNFHALFSRPIISDCI